MSQRVRRPTPVVLAAMLATASITIAAADDGTTGAQGADATQARPDAEELSPSEQLDEGQRIIDHGNSLHNSLQAMVERARRGGDIVLVDCVTPFLAQADGYQTSAQEHLQGLQQAAHGNDADERNQQYTLLTVLDQKFDLIEQEANQCLGQNDFSTGSDQLTVEVDRSVPNEDPNQLPDIAPVPAVPFIPPPASPPM